jgi:8-oxo-dGTP diphosphatase
MFRFNVRVYGVLVNEQNEVLVSDEKIRGKFYTKFPGGGLEFGEGTRDCLKREFLEELDLSIEVGEHIYTTDYFQVSAFNPDHQILSIYYKVKALEPIAARISTEPFQFDEAQLQTYNQNNETESFRLIPFEELTEESVTLPIDKIVVRLLKQKGF